MPLDDSDKKPEVNIIKSSKSNNPIPGMVDEATLHRTAVDPDSQLNPWNADDLYQKAGNYSIYEKMLKDDQVSVALAIKKDLVVGSGFHIVCESDDHEDIRKDLETALSSDPEASFEDSLMEMLSAYEYGFSVSEKQFKLRTDGSLTLKAIKARNPVAWLFHQDVYGNVTRYEQQGVSDKSFSNINPNALIHFVNNSRFGNPYGTSDLRSAYQAYFIKCQIIKYYAIFLEKAASPIPKAKYNKSATSAQVAEIYNAIKKFQTSTAICYPDNFELDFLEATGDHGKSYIDGINMMNMFIGRALFVPDLLGFQGGPTTGGSQALGREQMVVFFKHIMRRRRILENAVNNHIIKPIVEWNHGPVENYPKFKLKPIEEVQAERNARLWLEAVKSRVWPVTNEEINHFKKIIEFPETTEEELAEMEDAIEAAAVDAALPDSESEEKKETDDPKSNAEKSNENRDRSNFAAEKKYQYPIGNYHKKTDFSAIEKQLDSDLDLLIAESEPILKQIVSQFGDDLRKLRVAEVSKLAKLERLKFRPSLTKKLTKLLDKAFKRSFENSQVLAQKEVTKGADKFAIQPVDEFLETLATEDLNFIYDWEYKITKDTRVKIIAAIKDGLPIASVVDELNGVIAEEARVAIDRYARTKFTEVMNKGRLEFFKSTNAVAAYQYAAVLDDRTTDICNGLHGKIFVAGSEPVPPMHFNCRSTLVPVTIYEEFTPDTEVDGEDIEKFIDENKGKGFAKQ